MYLVSATPTKLQVGVSLSEVTHSSSFKCVQTFFYCSVLAKPVNCHVFGLLAVPDLPLCLGVLKHRAPLAMDFYLCGAILNVKVFCFGAIPDIMLIV